MQVASDFYRAKRALWDLRFDHAGRWTSSRRLRALSMDKILINGLRFDAIIGIYPRERREPQPIEISLSLACDIRQSAISGDLSDSLNYAAISETIIRFTQKRQAQLIETLAEELWQHLQSQFNIEGAQISILKPNAVPEARSVGVSITRGNFS